MNHYVLGLTWAFMVTLRPKEGAFEELKLSSNDPSVPLVAVPSRINRRPMPEKPLNGMRFATKDVYHLAGLKTSLGSLAFYNFHGPELETAEAITKLLDLGAVILGKLKLTQFEAWEEPIEAKDYPAPWNPRADGFQSPGGSSSGPASALAAYDWLDFTLGSDSKSRYLQRLLFNTQSHSLGQYTTPELMERSFGIRPTWGTVSHKGMSKGVEELDTAGCYVRSLRGLHTLSNLWLDHEKMTTASEGFTSIIWPSDLWDPVDKGQRELARKFVNDLETYLGVAAVDISFQKTWEVTPPSSANASSLSEFIDKACDHIFYETFQRLKPFIESHKEMYVSPSNEETWGFLRHITKDQWEEARKRLDVYRSWFSKTIAGNKSSHPLFVLPIEYLAPRYRDEKPDFRKPPPGVNSLTLSPVTKSPELVLPIGEIPYQSKITGRQEKLPFAVGVMGPPGSDLELIKTVQDVFEKSGRPAVVHTGKTLFKQHDET